MSTALLELRIYAGLHAGAKVGIRSLEDTLVLGSDPKNDVILRDASFTSESLHLSEAGWHWQGANPELVIPWGQAVQMGSLVFAVDYQSAPWPQHQAWTIAWSHEASVSPVHALAEPAPVPVDVEPSEPLLETTALSSAPAQTGRTVLHSSYRVAAMVAALSLLLLIVWWNTRLEVEHTGSTVDIATAIQTKVSSSQADNVTLLQRAVESVGFGRQVRVVALPQDKFQLIGVVANEGELDAVLRAASTVTRKIVPNVLIQDEFAARLQALVSQLPSTVMTEAVPVGVVSLRNIAAQNEALTEAKRLIQQELPELVAFRVESNLTAVAEATPRDTETYALQQRLKKKIAAIQSGPNAYVLLASGQKVMPGGGLEHHQLLSIEDQSLLFQDAHGNTIRLQR